MHRTFRLVKLFMRETNKWASAGRAPYDGYLQIYCTYRCIYIFVFQKLFLMFYCTYLFCYCYYYFLFKYLLNFLRQ